MSSVVYSSLGRQRATEREREMRVYGTIIYATLRRWRETEEEDGGDKTVVARQNNDLATIIKQTFLVTRNGSLILAHCHSFY